MAYDREWLAGEVLERLNELPRTALKDVAKGLGVHRHTLLRAVRARFGLSFRDLRADTLRRRAIDLLRAQPNEPIKCVACELGYSARHSGSFSRRVRGLLGSPPTLVRRAGRRRRAVRQP